MATSKLNPTVAAMLHQMHPDIFEATPTTAYIARCWKERDRNKIVQDFWLELLNSNLDVQPIYYMGPYWSRADCTVKTELYEIDAEATTKKLARVVKWLRAREYKVTKKYTETEFQLKITINEDLDINFTFYADRQVLCRKVYIGTKIKPAEPEQVVEEYDWECEKIAFTGIDTD